MNFPSEEAQKFVDWTKIKIRAHFSDNEVYFYEKEIWWIHLGQNIGSEQNGKNTPFERPILIIKKFNRDTFLGVSMSTKIRDDRHSYILNRNGVDYDINLSQIRTLSRKRLLRKIGKVPEADFKNIKEKLKSLL
ncbi:MAG: type II toxin-antitoxin system PemK/MazF family toxin [Candidatus Falkowbacteria bacterium]